MCKRLYVDGLDVRDSCIASRGLVLDGRTVLYWQTLKCIFLVLWVAEKKEVMSSCMLNVSTTLLLVLEIERLPGKCQTLSICTQHLHIQLT